MQNDLVEQFKLAIQEMKKQVEEPKARSPAHRPQRRPVYHYEDDDEDWDFPDGTRKPYPPDSVIYLEHPPKRKRKAKRMDPEVDLEFLRGERGPYAPDSVVYLTQPRKETLPVRRLLVKRRARRTPPIYGPLYQSHGI